MLKYYRRDALYFYNLFYRFCSTQEATFTSDSHIQEFEHEAIDVTEEIDRSIGKTPGEQVWRLKKVPHQPPNPKGLNVAIIGAPNHGKSTLTNALMKWKVCSVSSKVHTTKLNQIALINEGDTQIKLVDTPGVISKQRAKRCNLDMDMIAKPNEAANEADFLLVLVDASNKLSHIKLPTDVVKLLQTYKDKPSALILNKVDLVRDKKKLLSMTHVLTAGKVGGDDTDVRARHPSKQKEKKILFDKMRSYMTKMAKTQATQKHKEGVSEGEVEIREESVSGEGVSIKDKLDKREEKYDLRRYEVGEVDEDGMPMFMTLVDPHQRPPQYIPDVRGWPHFSRVFMVSALVPDGIEELKDYLLKISKDRFWEYDESVVTDLSPYHLALMTVREKFLDALSSRLPYKITMTLDYWKFTDAGVLEILVSVASKESDRDMSVLIGESGNLIREVTSASLQDLSSLFRCDVNLKISVVKLQEIIQRSKTKRFKHRVLTES